MNSARKRIAVAMSGGVDSSVAAALLVERGLCVHGYTMRLWRAGDPDGAAEKDLVAGARQVCAHLGIEHHVVDLGYAFRRGVVEHFVSEYAHGRTPNPCVRCNWLIKFGLLLERVLDDGFDAIATGHYVRVGQREGRYQLLAGLDGAKDQSYFLYMLGQRELAHCIFPLGELTKPAVRRLAAAGGLPVAHRPESQDVCFVPGGDYRQLLSAMAPGSIRPGPILSAAGDVLGEHRGLPYYTVGQRQGLGISAPRALYVMALDVARNALIVGHADELGRSALLAEDCTYVAGEPPTPGQAVVARIRYRGRPTPATVWPEGEDTMRVEFDRPLRDITPGQAVVIYDGVQVLGGGAIRCALKPSARPVDGAESEES